MLGAIKAGLAPFLYWLPASYPVLSGPVAALFAGMMTKLDEDVGRVIDLLKELGI